MTATDDLIQQIDDLLPQTQCEQCGHPGCRPYAEAIAQGEAHNKCPPGGEATQQRLAELLNRHSLPLDIPDDSQPGVRLEALIREDECIGCTKCIQACPVDAIVGAAQLMHSVISAECTGCELCVAPCPVDCIDIVARPAEQQRLDDATRFHARKRYLSRNARLEQRKQEKQRKRAEKQAARQQQQAKETHMSALPEAPLAQLKADYHKAKHQLQQLEAALQSLQRQGREPASQHLEQRDTLRQQVSSLKQQIAVAMESAKQQLVDQGDSLTQLKLAATRSELAWRRASNAGADAATLEKLDATRKADQEKLSQRMQEAGLTD